MPCYYPLTAWKSREPDAFNPVTKKLGMTFDKTKGYPNTETKLACGQCVGCRLDRSRQWAIRCMHEASLHPNNCFITLTYSDDHLPTGGSLDKRHFVLFMKRLRKKFGDGIRFFHCGEYGGLLGRPHHHACLFNFTFPDKVVYCRLRSLRNNDNPGYLYGSDILAILWPYGFSTIGDVTFESAAYVARYVMKKITGDKAEEHYAGREPEYITMSRRPGIGRRFYEQYKDDLYNHDQCVVRHNFILKPPKYYDNLFDITDADRLLELKRRRKAKAMSSQDNTPERLAVRERVKKLKIQKLIRSFETNTPT